MTLFIGKAVQFECEALQLNIDGIFPGTGNVDPRLLIRLWEQKDQESFRLFYQLKDQVRQTSLDNYIQGLKNNLRSLGIIEG